VNDFMKTENIDTTNSGLPLAATPLFASLSERVVNALADASLAVLHPRHIAIKLAEQFWREDNPTSNLKEPPSMVYEIVEKTVIEVKANASDQEREHKTL